MKKHEKYHHCPRCDDKYGEVVSQEEIAVEYNWSKRYAIINTVYCSICGYVYNEEMIRE